MNYRNEQQRRTGRYVPQDVVNGLPNYSDGRPDRNPSSLDGARESFDAERERWSEERNWRGYEDYPGSSTPSRYAGGTDYSRSGQLASFGPFSGRGPKGYQRSDERIKEDISERLTMHPDLDASGIELDVQNGEVTLSGTTPTRHCKRLAEDIAEQCSGVKDVNNTIKVTGSQADVSQRSDRSEESTPSGVGAAQRKK